MRGLGIIIGIAGVILLITGITQTNAIHAYNMAQATEGIVKNDIPSILMGICGGIIIIVGVVFVTQPKKKHPA
jgi:hypothetical protein